MLPDREYKVTSRYVPAVKLGNLEVGEEVKSRWVGAEYKSDHYYNTVITSIDVDQQTCTLVFPVKMVFPPNWDTDTTCPMWVILHNDGYHTAQRPHQPLHRPFT